MLFEDAKESGRKRKDSLIRKDLVSDTFYLGLRVGLLISAVFWSVLAGLLYALAEHKK